MAHNVNALDGSRGSAGGSLDWSTLQREHLDAVIRTILSDLPHGALWRSVWTEAIKTAVNVEHAPMPGITTQLSLLWHMRHSMVRQDDDVNMWRMGNPRVPGDGIRIVHLIPNKKNSLYITNLPDTCCHRSIIAWFEDYTLRCHTSYRTLCKEIQHGTQRPLVLPIELYLIIGDYATIPPHPYVVNVCNPFFAARTSRLDTQYC